MTNAVYRSFVAGWLLAFAFSAVAVAADVPVRQEFKVDGVAREALVYIPASAKTDPAKPDSKAKPAPLVFVFHGHGGSMLNGMRSFHVHELWPEAIVIYPQGLPTPGKLTDPEGKKAGWQSGVGEQGDRDLKFFDEMLKSIHASAAVDDKHVFCTGHSNGGQFTYILWSARSDVFAAVAPSGAAAFKEMPTLKPKPMLHIAGSKDPLVKFEWQQMTINGVKKLNGCDAEGKKAETGVITYPSKTGTPVATYIYDGGHAFPKDTPELIVRFLKGQP